MILSSINNFVPDLNGRCPGVTIKMSVAEPMSLEEYRAYKGREVAVSSWIELDQARIDAFAAITGDFQWIHVDPERARAESEFGGTIAHGMLTLSLIAGVSPTTLPILSDRRMSVNYGFDKVRFLSPVKSGSKVRVRYTLHDVMPRGPKQFLLMHDVTVEKEDGKQAAAARTISMAILH